MGQHALGYLSWMKTKGRGLVCLIRVDVPIGINENLIKIEIEIREMMHCLAAAGLTFEDPGSNPRPARIVISLLLTSE